MHYDKEHTSEISFPLGGIGAGCVGLAGNGHLVDWELFNKPNKLSSNGFSHFAVRSERAGEVEDFRVLQGDTPPPYSGPRVPGKYSGFGFGPLATTLEQFPHFREHRFDATFPVAEIAFHEPAFPARPTLTAWSVLIPGNSRDSSLPAAFFDITLTADEERDFTVFGVLGNPYSDERRFNRVCDSQLTAFQAEGQGELTLTLDADGCTTSYQTENFRGGWYDHLEKYYDDVMTAGPLADRKYETPCGKDGVYFGILAAHFHLKAGESRTVHFVLTWHCTENCCNDWYEEFNLRPIYERHREEGIPETWRPWYTTVWPDSRASAKYARTERERLREETFRFRDAMCASTIPPAELDGATACLAVLKSPTCLRLEDGTFWGWEGVGLDYGVCFGSCAHVWNYAQALPFLFPDLERSMRVSHLKYGVDEYGAHHFRIMLPLGIHIRPEDGRPCADGQFGEIMKFYRDWRLCGDDGFLQEWWPTLKKMLEFAWSPRNADRWDPERRGVLTGRQHHTLDMELFGPNLWLTAFYLGALKAMALMAEHLGEEDYRQMCMEIYERGRKYVEEGPMFNGEYFTQQVDLSDRSVLEPYDETAKGYWKEETRQLKYQIGSGCNLDGHLAQWFATAYGLGELYDPALNRKLLQAIFKYNFKSSMRSVFNTWRTFSLDDEGGTQICTWPHGGRPVVPLTYHSETMPGFEWAFANHLITTGLFEEGGKVAAAIRGRFDGRRRNPWNEFEFGSNYARSMAAFGLFNAYSHLTFGPKELGFNPAGDLTVFWSIGSAWGTFTRKGTAAILRLLGGNLELERLKLPFAPNGGACFQPPRRLKPGDCLEVS